MTRLHFLAAACLSLALAGCGSVPLPQHQASVETIQNLRGSGIAPVKIGAFTKDAKMPAKQDQSVVSRSVTVISPDSGSFAIYLGNVVKTELEAAGKFDANSDTVVQGVLTTNELSTGIGKGKGALGAHFTMTRAGAQVFDKSLVAEQEWEGNFVGAVAIPDAINHYQSLYKELAAKLLSDEDFRKAASAPAGPAVR
jgi:hypothetical protein